MVQVGIAAEMCTFFPKCLFDLDQVPVQHNAIFIWNVIDYVVDYVYV